MARAIWTGYLSFGLVNVPVGLYSATHDNTIHFHQFARGTSARIRQRRVNEDTGEDVDYDDIVKGYELDDGNYVMLEAEELDEIAPGRSKAIEITDFVDAAEIDPIYYQRSYYLAPDGEAGATAYALLVEAMEDDQRIAIANLVMRSKQYLAAIRPRDGVLVLETMWFGDEVRDPAEELDDVPVDTKPARRDLEMAKSLIDALTTAWDPANYHDTYRERVLELIEAKRSGEEVVVERDEAPSDNVVDLMETLRRSVEAAKARKGPGNAHQRRRTDLAAMTKTELYDLAQELDVSGRSSMSKEDLETAVEEAMGREGGKRAS